VKVIIFGATGMIGQGVLRECLLDGSVDRVLAIGRNRTGWTREKLHELVIQDLQDFTAVEHELGGYDACFFCLGVASAGMTEANYRRVTYGIAMAAAKTLVERNPAMTFIFVSGAGADSSGRGRVMWARVKGETENAILALPFKGAYVFRPAFVQPMHGIESRTTLYRVLYRVFAPLYPVLRAIAPSYVTTTAQIGRAMLIVARQGAPTRVLESKEISAAAR
jgi:uncharacterized protein YbjT (DUF2867 family)